MPDGHGQQGAPTIMAGRTVTWVAFAALVALVGCAEKGPYLDISGGSFVFNYARSEIYAGFVAAPLRTLPEQARIEATFENPAGGVPIVLQDVTPGRREYSFLTDALHGVRADRDYDVTVRLIAADGEEIEKIVKKFHSDIDQSKLPDKPLVVGPGYARNPDLKGQ
jgi:hypothetical protein